MKLSIAVALLLCVVPAAARPDDRASYDQELARLRAESAKKLAQIRADVALLERKADLLRRVIPAEFEADLIEQRLHALAKVGDMGPLQVKRAEASQRVRLADGRATPYERFFLDVSGRAPYQSVGYFLDRVGHLPALVELVSLSLEADPGGTVRFAARLGFPCYQVDPNAPRPALPAPPRDQSLSEHRLYYERLAETAREPIRRIQAEVDAITEMRAEGSPTRFIAALTRLEAETGTRLVALNRMRLDARAVVEGMVVGAPARAGLRPAFDRAGFVVDTLEVAPSGECRAFSVGARLKPPEEPAEAVAPPIEMGRSPFRGRAASSCGATPHPHKGNVVSRGTNGGVSVRLRDTDIADVFNVLATVTQAAFVVDADVKGRVNVEFERATLDEALDAMKAAGVAVGQGPLRRVSLVGVAQRPVVAAPYEQRVSLFFKDGVLLDVVRLFEEISGRKAWAAPVANGRVTLFAPEVPWDVALQLIAASVGMTAVIEEERIFVGPAAMAKSPWTMGAVEAFRAKTDDDDAGWGRVVELSKLGPDDLTLVGTAHTPDGLRGVAYGPGRLLWVLEPGVELFEARVDAVDSSALTFATKDGRKKAMRFTP